MSIPKLAHFIWLGEDFPSWAADNIREFKTLHPDWEMRAWHTLPDNFPEDLRRIFESLPWYSSRADIFRYWLLYEYGGVYCDTDILTLRSFEPMLAHEYFLAPCHPTGHAKPHLTCALMGGAAKSAASKAILAGCREQFAKAETPRRITYGPDLLTQLFTPPREAVTILPMHYFYPIPDRETAHAFWHADSANRTAIMQKFAPQFTDDQPPYALHLWGVNNSTHRQVTDI